MTDTAPQVVLTLVAVVVATVIAAGVALHTGRTDRRRAWTTIVVVWGVTLLVGAILLVSRGEHTDTLVPLLAGAVGLIVLLVLPFQRALSESTGVGLAAGAVVGILMAILALVGGGRHA